jgi:hypothetical protein
MAGLGRFLAALYVGDAGRRFAFVGQIAASARHSRERPRPQKLRSGKNSQRCVRAPEIVFEVAIAEGCADGRRALWRLTTVRAGTPRQVLACPRRAPGVGDEVRNRS